MNDNELTAAIANDLGIGNLPVEEQQELITAFGDVALKAATVAILEKMPQDKLPEFEKLAQGGDAAALSAFLDREVPGHEELAKQAVSAEVEAFKKARTA